MSEKRSYSQPASVKEHASEPTTPKSVPTTPKMQKKKHRIYATIEKPFGSLKKTFSKLKTPDGESIPLGYNVESISYNPDTEDPTHLESIVPYRLQIPDEKERYRHAKRYLDHVMPGLSRENRRSLFKLFVLGSKEAPEPPPRLIKDTSAFENLAPTSKAQAENPYIELVAQTPNVTPSAPAEETINMAMTEQPAWVTNRQLPGFHTPAPDKYRQPSLGAYPKHPRYPMEHCQYLRPYKLQMHW